MSPSVIKNAYDRESFIDFIKDFIPDYQDDYRSVNSQDTKYINKAYKLGVSNQLELAVFELEHEGNSDKRIGLALEGFRLMKDTGVYNALVIFFSKESSTWRFSLMTTSQELKSGKVVNAFSNPKRYSYVLGYEAKTATPHKFLISKGKINSFEDLLSRFSVEVVNNEFYKEIAKLYDQLVGTEDVDALIKLPSSVEESHRFAARLIGRIVFCWFLREKHSPNSIPLISKSILSKEASTAENYYHKTLAPLFFQVLNEPIHKRTERFKVRDFGKVPYLNGGLFAPQYDDYYKFDETLSESIPGLVNIPDEWLRRLFDLLELYHFTVDENTSVDIDLSIDPEMLGRIFENLLARISPETGETVRKSTGSFYTPREIVEYMVDESLVQYLATSTTLSPEQLKALVSYDLNDDKEHPLDTPQIGEVVKALSEVKILDPACGSGAFPIGVLQKVVFILQQVDPEAKIWFENQIANTVPEVRHLIEREFAHKNFDYIRKLGVIRESIFGIDIQPIATEIARLRCFLTLIVDERVNDEEDNRGVYPLPNLDFKFVTANSLIKLGETNVAGGTQEGLFEDQSGIEELKKLRDDYFNSHNSEREALKVRFVQAQNRMLQNMIANHSHGFSDITQKLSTWDPFTQKTTNWFDSEWMFGLGDGFNIVIGNPPYIQVQKMDEHTKDTYKSEGYAVFSKTTDIYCIFYEFGIKALAPEGILSFITSNSWLRAKYGESLRKLFAQYNPLSLVNFNDSKVFASAVVETNILVLQNATNKKDLLATNYNISNGQKLTINDYLNENGTRLSELDHEGWTIGEKDSVDLKAKLTNETTLLKDSDVSIYRGFTTGFNEAYFIDSATRDKLVREDPNCDEIIRPAVRGKDISKYGYRWSDVWIILVKAGWTNANKGLNDPEAYFKSAYPSIYNHFKHVADTVKGKGKGLYKRDDQGDYWWELRSCVYYEEFAKEKIIWGELSDKPKFAFDTNAHFANNSIFLMTGANLKYILAILNSSLGKWYFDQIATSSGMGTNRWLKYKIERLPIKNIDISNEKLVASIEALAELAINSSNSTDEHYTNIDKLVYSLYQVTDAEIKIIEGRVA
jgi:adenine-specific DNA-methyltransferase